MTSGTWRWAFLIGLVGVGGGLALEDQAGGDRERPGKLVGVVHQEAIGEEPPLRVPADEVAGHGVGASSTRSSASDTSAGLSRSVPGKPLKVLLPTKLTGKL